MSDSPIPLREATSLLAITSFIAGVSANRGVRTFSKTLDTVREHLAGIEKAPSRVCFPKNGPISDGGADPSTLKISAKIK
jgi:hypothetical protein